MREENGADHFARAASGEEEDLENGKETGKDTDRQGRQVEGLDIEEEVKGKEDRKIRGVIMTSGTNLGSVSRQGLSWHRSFVSPKHKVKNFIFLS